MTNPDNVGGLRDHKPVPLSEELRIEAALQEHGSAKIRLVRMAQQAERLEELCRAAPAGGDVECFVREMRTSKGSEFFVVVKRDGRELTPHMYTERWKAEYDVASWQHLLCGAPKPDILAYGPSAPFDRAPAGSGEVEQMAKRLDDARAIEEETSGLEDTIDAMRTAAALLRKLQQGADAPKESQ